VFLQSIVGEVERGIVGEVEGAIVGEVEGEVEGAGDVEGAVLGLVEGEVEGATLGEILGVEEGRHSAKGLIVSGWRVSL